MKQLPTFGEALALLQRYGYVVDTLRPMASWDLHLGLGWGPAVCYRVYRPTDMDQPRGSLLVNALDNKLDLTKPYPAGVDPLWTGVVIALTFFD